MHRVVVLTELRIMVLLVIGRVESIDLEGVSARRQFQGQGDPVTLNTN
jgi:hypothetical protein